MIEETLRPLFLISIMLAFAYFAIKGCAEISFGVMKERIGWQEKGEYYTTASSPVWCRRAKEYSDNAEICYEKE